MSQLRIGKNTRYKKNIAKMKNLNPITGLRVKLVDQVANTEKKIMDSEF
jgi:hypothetical protein